MENEMEEDRNEGTPRKRLLTDLNPKGSFVTASPESTVSSDSSSDRFAKKTRDLPNLSDCHSCSVRINYTNPRERLQPLDSMWRVVLLCKKCIKQVKSSELCPYCFSAVADDKDCFKCRDCHHSIHKDCAAKYGSESGFSVCVDCWIPDAVANSIRAGKRKNRKKNTESSEQAATLSEPAVAATASENALKKAVINSSPKVPRYACLMSSFTGKNTQQMRYYSRRRASKKTTLMNSGNLGEPLIFYSRRRENGGLSDSITSNAPLIFYSRRREKGGLSDSITSKAPLIFYSRRREKGGLSDSITSKAPLIFYSRRREKGDLSDKITSNAPLIFYSRRRSSSKSCLHVRECECCIIDKHVSISSTGLKASKSGSNADNSSSGNECEENDGRRCDMKPHRYLLKYYRIGKGTPRSSVFDCGSCTDSANLDTEDMSDTKDFGNGEICEKCDKNANRFLLKYKRAVRSKSGISCRIGEFSPLLPSNASTQGEL